LRALLMAVTNEQRAEVLREEVDWFTRSLENAEKLQQAGYGYSPDIIRGYKYALGWLKLHLKMAEEDNIRRI
jgi:hypothetical protein